MALTVGGQKFSKRDTRLSSYRRINRNRSAYKESNLGKRTGGETISEKVNEPSASSLQEANAQAAASKQPEPIASAAEGGVIFSDDFRGTPVASAQSGGTIYINNQALPRDYERRNGVGGTDNRNFTPASRFSDNNQVGTEQTFSGTIKPAEKQSFFKTPVSYLERKGSEYESKALEAGGVSPSKSFGYGAKAFGIAAITKTLRFGEAVARVGDPSEKGTIRQTASLIGSGYKELRTTGGLPSAGSYIRENPVSASVDAGLAAATAKISLPKRFPYPKAGVIGEVIEDAPKISSYSSFSTSPSVESAAGKALRTNSAADIDAAIGRLNRDVYRKVDVTIPTRLDNILPNPQPREMVTVRTTRSINRFDSSGGRTGRRGTYLEATQKAPKEAFLGAPLNPPKIINLTPRTPPSRVFDIATRRLNRARASEFDFVDIAQDTRKINFNKILDLERNPTSRITELTRPEYVNVYKRFTTEPRKRFVDTGEGKIFGDTKTQGYVLGIERIPTGERTSLRTGVRLTKKNIDEIVGGAYRTELRAARKAKAPDDTAARFFELNRKIELKGKKPELKRRFGLIQGKKGQAQLFPQETVVKENPADVLRKKYGGLRRPSRLRSRASDDLGPPSRSRQTGYPEFPESKGGVLANELESSSASKYINKGRFKLPYISLLSIGQGQKSDVSALTGNAQRSSFRTYQESTPTTMQEAGTSQGQFSFRSLSSGVQKGSQLLTGVLALTGAKALTSFVKPGKNSINRYFRSGESGGGGSSVNDYVRKSGSKKKYVPSFVGIELGIKATKQQRRAAGTRGYGLSGLEVRGI